MAGIIWPAVRSLEIAREMTCSKGHRMKIRHKHGDETAKFYGCSEYPDCKETKDYNYEDKLIFVHYYNSNLKHTSEKASSLLFKLKYGSPSRKLQERYAQALYKKFLEQTGEYDNFKAIDFFTSIPNSKGMPNSIITALFQLDPLRELTFFPDMIQAHPGKSQKQAKTLEARMNNIKGRFHLKDPQTVSGSLVAIIDDVVTTGATMNEASLLIYSSSRQSSYAGALAKANKK